jgi:protein SCO1
MPMATKAPLILRVFQTVLWTLVLVAVGFLVVPRFLPVQQTAQLGPGVPLTTPFALVNQDGEPVTEEAILNKTGAWFYGFTNCPDVCPTALAEMAGLLKALGVDAAKLNAVFVTVDPERDTVPVMKEYVGFFDPRIVGLTGELSAVEAMVKSRFIYFAKVPKDDGSYTMDHSASIYLTNAKGEFVGTLDAEEPLDTKLAKLKRLIGLSA